MKRRLTEKLAVLVALGVLCFCGCDATSPTVPEPIICPTPAPTVEPVVVPPECTMTKARACIVNPDDRGNYDFCEWFAFKRGDVPYVRLTMVNEKDKAINTDVCNVSVVYHWLSLKAEPNEAGGPEPECYRLGNEWDDTNPIKCVGPPGYLVIQATVQQGSHIVPASARFRVM